MALDSDGQPRRDRATAAAAGIALQLGHDFGEPGVQEGQLSGADSGLFPSPLQHV
jgi:hypothetical protein